MASLKRLQVDLGGRLSCSLQCLPFYSSFLISAIVAGLPP